MIHTPKPFHSKRKNPITRGLAWISHTIRMLRGPMQKPHENIMAHIETLFVDDVFLNLIFPNRHRVSEKMMRSSQPHPLQIKRLAKQGLRTIVNLRGARDCASYYLEKAACEKYGVTLVDFPVNSRQPPTLEVLEHLNTLFPTLATPALLHCKAGSDRAGLASALYLLLSEKQPVEEAKKQLSLRYGHIRASKTGVLDHFLETYQASGVSDFMTWARTKYNRDAVIATHKTFDAVEWFAARILHRE